MKWINKVKEASITIVFGHPYKEGHVFLTYSCFCGQEGKGRKETILHTYLQYVSLCIYSIDLSILNKDILIILHYTIQYYTTLLTIFTVQVLVVYLSIYLSFYLSIYLSIYLSTVYLSIYLSFLSFFLPFFFHFFLSTFIELSYLTQPNQT